MRGWLALGVVVGLTGCGNGYRLDDIAAGRAILTVGEVDDEPGRLIVSFLFFDDARTDCGTLRGDVTATLDEFELTEVSRGGTDGYDIINLEPSCDADPTFVYDGDAAAFRSDADAPSVLTVTDGDTTLEFTIDGVRGVPGRTWIAPDAGPVAPGDAITLGIEPSRQRWDADPESAYSTWFLSKDGVASYELCPEGSLYASCASTDVQSDGATATITIPDVCEAGTWELWEPMRELTFVSCPPSFDCDPTMSWGYLGTGNFLAGIHSPVEIAFPDDYVAPACD